MKVRKLDTDDRQDVAQFVDFPFVLYRHCAQWVPPIRSDARRILNRRKHPFYAHSVADFFVVESEGQTLGRVAMLENRRYNEYKQAQAAFFGYFDVVEDAQAAACLLETAVAWAQQRGLTEIIGPRGVIGIDGSVLVDGFEHRPALTIPYNYSYYDAFIRAAGFEKLTDLLSGYLPADYELPARLRRVAEKVKVRRGFWIKRFQTKRELRQWVPRILAVHRQAFRQTASYYPPSDAETAAVIDTVLIIADPQLIKLVMKDTEIVGFILAYHDISAGLQRVNGRLWPFGWMRVLWEKRRTEWLNINGVGMLPAYQGLGGNALLYTEIAKTVNSLAQFRHVDIVQVDEQNTKSISDMENIGVRWYKRHRHYRLSLGAENK